MKQRAFAENELRNRDAESRRLATEVRGAEARLRAIVDVAPVGIVQVDRDRIVRYWNPAAERIFGWTAEEALGRPYPLIRVEHQSQVEQLFRNGFGGQILDGVELCRAHKDGSEVRVRTWNAPVRDQAGDIIALVGVFADVTEQRALEQRLARAEKLESIGRLAGGIAHDFNNVMTAVQGHADLLMESLPAHDPLREDIVEIRSSAARATDLTRQLLAFSRRQVLQPRVLDLATVVRGLRPMLSRLLGEHVRLDVDFGETIGRIEADPVQVEQVIVNLVINARDAMPTGGILRLGMDEVDIGQAETGELDADVGHGRYVRLAVADTGEGMDERTQQQIFEPFFTTKPAGEGTGLGLATVFGIVKQSGGHIRVHSDPGSGTTFEVLLPRVEKPLSRTAAPTAATARTVSGNETVLLIEDDAAIRSLVERVLKQNGYHVFAAATPTEALAILEAELDHQPDAVITDLMLPEMSGQEVARRITHRNPGVRIVFISGYTREDVSLVPADSGTSTFLAKPFRPVELLHTLRAVLDYEPSP
jgi:PAS domain S-box-containing protein